MQYIIFFFLLIGGINYACAQEDTLRTKKVQLSAVTIEQKKRNVNSQLESIENVLKNNSSIDLIQRGAYGSEILLNGMGSERSIITLDGMRIHSACTDKMDPATSYMDRNNVSSIQINSGSKQSSYANSIAGNIQLQTNKSVFGDKSLKGNVFTGYGTNNASFTSGGQLVFSSPKIYFQPTYSFRRASDYKNGDNKRVNNSGFTKNNASTKLGFKLNENAQLETYALFDQANNIGYPALPMDVKIAQMFLVSQTFRWNDSHCKEYPSSFLAKVYYNFTKHIMDDSKRQNVPIRMDMPGRTNTAGYIIEWDKKFVNESKVTLKLNGYWNQSIAEMTMYPADEKPDMYMYTWPNVHTISNTLYGQYTFKTGKEHWWNIGGNLQQTFYTFGDSMGYNTSTIFNPDVEWSQNRINKSIFVNWIKSFKSQHLFNIQLGYNDRAPNISEAFGFYLFNSYDRYDYIGNPFLKNENSLHSEINYRFNSKNENHIIEFKGTYFYIQNYIYGKISPGIYPMTIGGSGVKEYTQMKYANQFNLKLSYTYKYKDFYTGKWSAQYSYGKGENDLQLPFIAPVQLQWINEFNVLSHLISLAVNYNTTQKNVGTYFGENPTANWFTMDLKWEKTFKIKESSLTVLAGIENLTNQYYSTYSDWNKVPRIGRTFIVQLMYNF